MVDIIVVILSLSLLTRTSIAFDLVECPANIEGLECDVDPSPAAIGEATCVQPEGGEVTYSDSIQDGICLNTFTITRTWTCTDPTGNSESCEQIINVFDTTDPVIECPDDAVLRAGDAIPEHATCTDNCDGDLSIEPPLNPCSSPMTKQMMITWLCEDACDNTDDCQQLITCIDITCPAEITIQCDDDQSPDKTGMAICTNNAAGQMPTYVDVMVDGDCPNESTITRTWTCDDTDGNSVSCEQVINVQDDTPPIITCPDAVPIQAECIDNCDDEPSITFEDSGECSSFEDSGEYMQFTRTWSCTDQCEMKSDCQQTIICMDKKRESESESESDSDSQEKKAMYAVRNGEFNDDGGYHGLFRKYNDNDNNDNDIDNDKHDISIMVNMSSEIYIFFWSITLLCIISIITTIYCTKYRMRNEYHVDIKSSV